MFDEIKNGQVGSKKASGNVSNGYWNRDNRKANLNGNNPSNRNSDYGTRSGMWVYVFADFSQPPSMRPISAKCACAWNILVSLAIFSSRNRRNFKVEISRKLLALIK